MEKKNSFPQKRRLAREMALQALYQWEITKIDIQDLEKQFELLEEFQESDQAYFKEILNGVTVELDIFDHYIKRYIDRPLSELNPVELSVARIAVYELLKRIDVPYKVILNEALESAKKFGAQDGHKFVNGVLDKIAREVRYKEVK